MDCLCFDESNFRAIMKVSTKKLGVFSSCSANATIGIEEEGIHLKRSRLFSSHFDEANEIGMELLRDELQKKLCLENNKSIETEVEPPPKLQSFTSDEQKSSDIQNPV